MDTLQHLERVQRRRRGQTLAEFAITLPILLILLFGIVEFGRIFQAWVTLQNAARTGARYASTGQYDTTRYNMNLDFRTLLPNGVVDLNDDEGFIPCVDDGTESDRQWTGGPTRGTIGTYTPPTGGYTVNVYSGGIESLFATWYGGRNCDPRSESDQDRRKDMARILSIIDAARQGAAGLALEENQNDIPADKTTIAGWPFAQVWAVPNPREEQRSWFDVVVCSTRRKLDERADTYFDRVSPDASTQTDINTRFVTYSGETILRTPGGSDVSSAPTSTPRLPQAGCLMNEIDDDAPIDNAGAPWMDPGGPADTVTVIVTFNHPLITPLPRASQYIKMQARRSAIVESFRAADPQQAFDDIAPIEAQPPTFTPTFTYTPSITPLPSNTYTPSPVASRTPTYTPRPPFTCDGISVEPTPNGGTPGLFGRAVQITIRNDNEQATFLTRVRFSWPTILDYPGMSVTELALNSFPHWRGTDTSDQFSQFNMTDTNTDTSQPPNYFTSTSEADRTIAGNGDMGFWTGTLAGGPAQLSQYVSINSFGNTEFYLFNPLDPGNPCIKPLNLPPPTLEPPFDPNAPTNTPTFTPDCVGPQVTVRFIGFETFGIVKLEIRNERTVVQRLTDFLIQWKQVLPGTLTLDRVVAVARPGDPEAVEIWRANSVTQDSTPPTAGRTEGTWVGNFTFPAGAPGAPSVTALYIDFGGVGGRLSDSGIGMAPSDFNGTQFRIECGTSGPGNGGPGGPNSGLINLAEAPTPRPTNTPGPSRTPAPTLPPTTTFTPGPPTKTFTPGPSRTPVPPSRTPSPTVASPPVLPTLPDNDCLDGCT